MPRPLTPAVTARPVHPMVAPVAVFGAAVAVFAALALSGSSPACTAQQPCQADWVGSGLLGLLLLGGPAMALAPIVAVASAVVFSVLALSYETSSLSLWSALAVPAYAVVVIAIARWRAAQYATAGDRDVLGKPTETLLRSGAGAVPRGVGTQWQVAGGAALLVTVLLSLWAHLSVTKEADREAAADRTYGTVVGHPDDVTLRVRFPDDADPVSVAVLDATDYPIGQEVPFLTDSTGLRRPVAEPYDGSIWATLIVLLAGLGGAALTRAAAQRVALRRLITEPQPTYAVRVRLGWGVAAVYAANARLRDPALLQIRLSEPAGEESSNHPAGPHRTGHDDRGDAAGGGFGGLLGGGGMDGGYDADANEDEYVEDQPGLLVGAPYGGGWAAVVVAGATLLPVRPSGDGHGAPPAGDLAAAAAEGLRFDPLEEGFLDPEAAARDPLDRQEYTADPVVMIMRIAVAVAVASVGPAPWLGRLLGLPAALAVAIAGLLITEVVWWMDARTALAWDGGGVTWASGRRQLRMPWEAVRRLEVENGDTVYVSTGDTALPVLVRRPRWLPVWLVPGQSSAEDVVRSLRRTRAAALTAAAGDRLAPDRKPPQARARHRTAVLYLPTLAAVAWFVLLPVVSG